MEKLERKERKRRENERKNRKKRELKGSATIENFGGVLFSNLR